MREWNQRAEFCEARLINLIPAAVNAPSDILRFYAMVFMTKVGFEQSEAFNSEYLTAALERGLSDTNLYVRTAALSAALKYHGEDMRAELMRRALSDRSPIVRTIVLGTVKDCDQALLEERAKVETEERVQIILDHVRRRNEGHHRLRHICRQRPHERQGRDPRCVQRRTQPQPV